MSKNKGQAPRAIQELVPSISIENLLSQRDAIVERLHKVVDLLNEIDELSQSAFGSDAAAPRLECRRSHASLPDHLEPLLKHIDATAWGYLMHQSGLRTLMDATAREQWEKALYEGLVPELTEETIQETFKTLYQGRRDMFERGVVSCFKQLSWDYKTNNPCLFGKRIILECVLDVWNASSNRRYTSGPSWTGCDRLDDLLRVMLVLDGGVERDHRQGAYHVLSNFFGYNKYSSDPVEIAGMISVRCYKNGNGHVTFLRLDLVDCMNQIVAKHYPEALPPSR